MLQAFYSATVGAQQQMQRMNVHANNISNVNTYGYKTQAPAFQALMYGMLEGIDGNQLPRGSGTVMALTGSDMASGALEETGRDLDFAILGNGFFAVYEPTTGEVSFTRDGSLMFSPVEETVEEAEGADPVGARPVDTDQTPITRKMYYLCDGEGRFVLGNDGYPIALESPDEDFQVGVFSIQYLDGLERVGSGRFVMNDKNGAVWVSDAQVRSGFLESSNADLATELTGVIEAQRSYSYALKMVTTADEVATTINGLVNR